MNAHDFNKEYVYDTSRTYYQSLPERPVNQPEPKPMSKETAERILREGYSPLQLASVLNECASPLIPRIHQAVRLRDKLELGKLMLDLYDEHIDNCASEMVEKQA